MALTASVVTGADGKTNVIGHAPVDNTIKTGNNSTMGKDDFLKLLVAQMKYQDPLEPQSNTEYVSQFATFSELEQMQNMSSAMESQKAFAYVGKEVTISQNLGGGRTTTLTGIVDYVTMEGGKTYVSIAGNKYPADSVVSVQSDAYTEAKEIAALIVAEVGKLNPFNYANYAQDGERIANIANVYGTLSDYQKSFLSTDLVSVIAQYADMLRGWIAGNEIEAELKKINTDAEDKKSIDDIVKIYDALSTAQKSAVPGETIGGLLEKLIEIEESGEANGQYNAAIANIYNSLDAAQTAKISQETKNYIAFCSVESAVAGLKPTDDADWEKDGAGIEAVIGRYAALDRALTTAEQKDSERWQDKWQERWEALTSKIEAYEAWVGSNKLSSAEP